MKSFFSTKVSPCNIYYSTLIRGHCKYSKYSKLNFLGTFPLSETNLLTAEEREQFLPATRTFASVLGKENVDPEEISLLLEQSRELSTLIPDNLIGRLGGGLGLGGLLSQ